MTLKPTRRRNGQMHASISVKFQPGLQDVLAIVAHHHYLYPDHTHSRSSIAKVVREYYGMKGWDSIQFLSEESGDDWATYWDWAEEEVRRLFPEWDS